MRKTEFSISPVRLFIVKLAILTALVCTLDYIVGSILRHYYFTQESGLLYRTTYALQRTKADLLVFGASKANHHYDPNVFEDVLHISSYNAGRDGQIIFYHSTLFSAILKRYTPSIVILDCFENDIYFNPNSYDRLSEMLPYYKDYPEVRPAVALKGPFERIKLLSKIYPFNSYILSIAIGNTELNRKRSLDIKGYIPFYKSMKPVKKPESQPVGRVLKETVDPNKISFIKKFFVEAANHHIKLFLIISPTAEKRDNLEFVRIFQNLGAEYNVPVWDYSQDSRFLNHYDYFADDSHLNHVGATKFSTEIAKRITDALNKVDDR